MRINHQMGGDMRVVLTPADLERLETSGSCHGVASMDDVKLVATVEKDDLTPDPTAHVDGHSVRVYVPDGELVLPLGVDVQRPSHVADYYFGATGKICLMSEVDLRVN